MLQLLRGLSTTYTNSKACVTFGKTKDAIGYSYDKNTEQESKVYIAQHRPTSMLVCENNIKLILKS